VCLQTKMESFHAPIGKPLNKSNSSPYFTENCVVCLENASTIELRPCGHAIICQACVARVDDTLCPLCRQKVEVIRVKGAKELYPFHPKLREGEASEGNKEQSEQVLTKNECALRGDGGGKAVSHSSDGEVQGHLEVEVPFSNVLEERRAFESFVRRRTYQVVVSGSVEVNTKAFVDCLLKQFQQNLELFHMEDFSTFEQQRMNNVAKVEFFSDSSLGGSVESEPLVATNESVSLRTLFDTTSSADAYRANVCVEDFPLHIRSFRIWELVRMLRQQKKKKQDLFVLCCSTFSEISLNELVAMDELISLRYAMCTPRIWVFVDVALSEKERLVEKKLTFNQVEEAFLKVPIHRRASKLIHIQQMDKQSLDVLGHDIVSVAKQSRRLERYNSSNHFCCFM